MEAAIDEVLESCVFKKDGRQRWGIVNHRNRPVNCELGGVPPGGNEDAVKWAIVNKYVRDRLDGDRWKDMYKKNDE